MKKGIKIICSLFLMLGVFGFNLSAETAIDEIYANIRIPFAGVDKRFKLNVLDLSYDAPYSATLKGYYDDSDTELGMMSDFELGKDYYALIEFKAKSGYSFSSSLKCFINGVETSGSGGTYKFYFKPLDVNSDNEMTLRFDKNDGSGETLDVTYLGTSEGYQLTPDQFDTPNAKSLVGWSINGVKYSRKKVSMIYPFSFTTIYSLYEDSVLYVGGTLVDQSISSDVFGDGSVYYDANTATLKLKDATILGAKVLDYYNVGIYSTGALTIELEGDNLIDDGAFNLKNRGIYAEDDLIIKGDGNASLTIKNDDLTEDIIGIEVLNQLEVSNCKLSILNSSVASTQNHGIHSLLDGSFKEVDLKIELADVGDTGLSFGYDGGRDLVLEDSYIDIDLGQGYQIGAMSAAISITSQNNTIEIQNKVGDVTYLYGLYTFGTFSSKNDLLKISLSESKETICMAASFMTLEDLNKGSVIETDSAYGYGIYVFGVDESLELLKGEYLIRGGTSAINIQPKVTFKEGLGLYYSDDYDFINPLYWLGNESLNKARNIQTGHVHNCNQLKKDKEGHWYECSCGLKEDYSKHIDADQDHYCDDCNQSLKSEHKEKDNDYKVVNTGIRED